MRILWWSNAPWQPTGYGNQTALFTPMIRDLGHEVALQAFSGLQGAPRDWEGMTVYPGGQEPKSLDVMEWRYQRHQADLIITLADTWCLIPGVMRELKDKVRLACWTPVDCKPLNHGDREALEAAAARPIAMSRHGEKMMRGAGLDPLYVPHGVDCSVFRPLPERDWWRRELGWGGRFVVGINSANRDHQRKGYPEQFRAFAAFRKTCPDALLSVHALGDNFNYDGLNLHQLAEACGIPKTAVQFVDPDQYLTGVIDAESMASWYGALDVLSCCSWGEGFGIPIIEAQACGTPVVVTNASAMSELTGPGWKVDGEPFWHVAWKAWWVKPSIPEITFAYKQAFEKAAYRRNAAREFALGYDAKTVLADYWVPVLAHLQEAATAAAASPARA